MKCSIAAEYPLSLKWQTNASCHILGAVAQVSDLKMSSLYESSRMQYPGLGAEPFVTRGASMQSAWWLIVLTGS
jgi:hypothetical protein